MGDSAGGRYQFGAFEANLDTGELRKRGQRVKLQEQPFRLLAILLANAGEIVARDRIQASIWPENTFVDFDGGLRVAIRKLREALGDDADDPRYVETIPKRGYRFVYPVVRPSDISRSIQMEEEPVALTVAEPAPNKDKRQGMVIEAGQDRNRRKRLLRWVILGVALLACAVGIILLPKRAKSIRLTEKDTVVLADFANSTGDPVFDGTLRQGMAVQLEQSPFLSLISDARIRQTLRLMGQPADARLTPEIAYQVCQRTQSAAVVEGSIASLGSRYVFGLKAVSCRNGDSLIEEQERAAGKEQILEAMDRAAVKLRERLGESLNTVERFHTPLEEATTTSFEALQAYSLGRLNMVGKAEFEAAIPFFQRAIRLDPNFAMAYAALGSDYFSLGETALSAENVRKAYELRSRVSEPENFYIESTYYHFVTGDLEKARQVYELSAQTYPRYAGTPLRLCVLYNDLGQYDNALAQILQAIRLDPSRAINYSNLVTNLTNLNRLDEAQAKAQEAQAKQLDSSFLRYHLYSLSFLRNDTRGMAEQVEWAKGKAGSEDELLAQEADRVAYFGQLTRSREFSRRALALSLRAERKGVAADYQVRTALREALFGNAMEARLYAAGALRTSASSEAQFGAALALALVGDTSRSQLLADDLAKRFPEDTVVQFNYLPVIRAQLALNRGQISRAIEELQPAAPYELGSPGSFALSPSLYPVYLRGNAYLAALQGGAAAAEFQKILDHRGIVLSEPIGVLAHLQIGRAFAMTGDDAKAKAAYEDFLTQWAQADANVPVLTTARQEYSRLR